MRCDKLRVWLHSHIASAPRLAEDVTAFVPVFPPGTARESAFGVRSVPNWADAIFLASLCSPFHDLFHRHLQRSELSARQPKLVVPFIRAYLLCSTSRAWNSAQVFCWLGLTLCESGC